MSDQTFIPGWQATATLAANTWSAIGSVLSLRFTKNVMTKPVFGQKSGRSLGGQTLDSFSMNGHLSAEMAPHLMAAFRTSTPVATSVQIGVANTPTDAGLHTGFVVLSALTMEANADGEWDWSAEAQFDGESIYTPGNPPVVPGDSSTTTTTTSTPTSTTTTTTSG